MQILIVHQHALLREAMCYLVRQLDHDAEVVEADDFAAMLRHAEQSRFLDLALMTLDLPDTDGYDAITRWRQRAPRVPLVVLADDVERAAVEAALAAGAHGVMPMTLGGKSLLAALRLVLSGGIYVPPQALKDCRGAASGKGARPHPDTLRELQLTPRRVEVLKYLAAGVSNKEMAHLLKLSEGTIKCHVAAILRVLRVGSRGAAVELAQNMGVIPRANRQAGATMRDILP